MDSELENNSIPMPVTPSQGSQNVCGHGYQEVPRTEPCWQRMPSTCRATYTAQWVLFSVFLNSKKGWQVPSNCGHEGFEEVFKSPAFSKVVHGRNSSVDEVGRVVCVNRPQGRLVSCAWQAYQFKVLPFGL